MQPYHDLLGGAEADDDDFAGFCDILMNALLVMLMLAAFMMASRPDPAIVINERDRLLAALTEARQRAEEAQRRLAELEHARAELQATVATSQARDQVVDLVQKEIVARKRLVVPVFHASFKHQRVTLYHRRGERSVLSFSSELLFEPASAELRPAGKATIACLGAMLRQLSASGRCYTEVVINGHTDETPIRTPMFPSNWALASARAASVVTTLVERERIPPEKLSTAGFAEFRAVAPSGEAIQDKGQKRRIEVELCYQADVIAKQLRDAGLLPASPPPGGAK